MERHIGDVMIFETRIRQARERMAACGIEGIIAAPSSDLFYLTGIRRQMSERFTAVILTQEQVHFISPDFELGNLSKQIRTFLTVHGYTLEDPFHIAFTLLKGTKIVSVARQVPSWMLLPLMNMCHGVEFVSADGILSDLRLIKSEEEYRIIRDVQIRSGKAFLKLLEHGLCGMKETDAVRLLVDYSAEQGINSSEPMVASGPNTALPHHRPGDRIISPGDVVFIDFGGADRDSLFRADTTRTFAIKRAPERLKEIYDIVLEANRAAFKTAAPGVLCKDIDKAARDIITQAGYGKYFTHSLGHGLGLDMHERPFLSRSSSDIVMPGQVFSDEPGIYIEGQFGVRTEDILYMRDTGPERLTQLPHSLMVCD